MSPERNAAALDAVEALVHQALGEFRWRPLLIGICGAQGSGKSTLAGSLAERMVAKGVTTAVLSLDDLYLGRAERERLAGTVHPLLRTRGVPGTHEVKLGLAIIDALAHHIAAALPRFDKAKDDRAPPEAWDEAAAGTALLILEGWCVGAVPQADEALAEPVNALERDEDPAGVWRRFVNDALAGDYQRLFGRIDRLVLLAAPGFDVVHHWRTEQERDLRAAASETAGMSDEEIGRFIQHYERLTRHILSEMPGRADLTLELAADRTVIAAKPQD